MIDFKIFDLKGLYSLYESFLNLISDYKEALKKVPFDNEKQIAFFNSQLEYFYYSLTEIKKEIPNKWDGKSTFSREYIFQITKYFNKPLILEFRPDSDAFHKYGKSIVGFGMYDKVLEEELLKNMLSNPPINTNGNIKIEVLPTTGLKPELISLIASEGIETIEIFEIAG